MTSASCCHATGTCGSRDESMQWLSHTPKLFPSLRLNAWPYDFMVIGTMMH